MSMQALRTWLAENPDEQARILEHNDSYVFFRFLDTGPVGSLNRPVTAQRSIATDLSLFPPGALAFLHTEYPVAALDTAGQPAIHWQPLDRFVLNQDTGGAIKGPGRTDVFWGQGPEATLAAGMMKQGGRLYFLVPKAAATDAAP
jgi:membrane-bound lytic murein transglycosylase A